MLSRHHQQVDSSDIMVPFWDKFEVDLRGETFAVGRTSGSVCCPVVFLKGKMVDMYGYILIYVCNSFG